jgi:hypothetical protein
MTVRRKVVGRHEDGRTIVAVAGDELPWKYDKKEDVYFVVSKDGKAKYIVGRSRPTGVDSKGHKLYRYWEAWVKLANDKGESEMISLGDTYMISWEGKEVCQIYESSRLEPKQLADKPKMIAP